MRYVTLTSLVLSLIMAPVAWGQSFSVGQGCQYPTIQQAIDAVPVGTHGILSIRPGTYSENLIIAGKDIAFDGASFNFSCGGPPGPRTINGGGNGSVMTISGNANVSLTGLFLTGGNSPQGGGINFIGQGSLEMSDTFINTNSAGDGAGINMSPSGPAELHLDRGTLISGNTADNDGGGVRIEGQTQMFMTKVSGAIVFNTAHGHGNTDGSRSGGGGLTVLGRNARAEIGSPGFSDASGIFFPTISSNRSVRGGGINVRNGGVVRMFSVAPGFPARIDNNVATDAGGGIFASSTDANAPTGVCGWGYSISHNTQGAIMADSFVALNFFRIEALDVCGQPAKALGAVECVPGAPCNAIDDNSINGSSTVESTITITPGGLFNAEQVEFRRNDAIIIKSEGPVKLLNCVMENQFSDPMLLLLGSAEIDGCTFVSTVSTSVLDSFGPLSLSDSILQTIGGGRSLTPGAGFSLVFIQNVIAREVGTLTLAGGTGISSADPAFVNLATGDYHLKPTSPAINYSGTGQAVDLDGLPRGIDFKHQGTPARYDIGAYEFDDIFQNGFQR